jgi:hypothetical protein
MKFVVSRKWNNPTINITMNSKEIALEMDAKEFLGTLVEIVGNPTFLVTKAQHLSKLNEAMEQVVEEVKRASVHG